MSVQLLDKTRKINKLLHNNNSSKVVFNDICEVLTGILDSNILVISKKGKVLGSSVCKGVEELQELIVDEVGGYIDAELNERLLGILSTKENVNLETLGFGDESKKYRAIITPIDIAGERLGTLFEYRCETEYDIDDIPQRNRIIAGLADYVIVMEARKKSGSLITADYAMEQGKEVYALPGRVTDALSEGTNHLIQQGAGIFVSVEDFLQELQLQPPNITTQIDFRKNLLEKDESLVYALLDFYPVGLGTLIEKSPYGLAEILPVLERLEQKGFIQETIPNYYIKTI